MMRGWRLFGAAIILSSLACMTRAAQTPSPATEFDLLIKGGTLYDGGGDKGRITDVAIRGDRIVGVGDFPNARAKSVIDAQGLAVAPGFINMLSWSNESLIQDGRSQGEIRQGVTTEIMGEGESMGPLNERMKKRILEQQKDIKYEIKWNTLSEYLRYLQCLFISRSPHRSRIRHWPGRQTADTAAARTNAGAGAQGNGSRRARYRDIANLSSSVLCQNGRVN